MIHNTFCIIIPKYVPFNSETKCLKLHGILRLKRNHETFKRELDDRITNEKIYNIKKVHGKQYCMRCKLVSGVVAIKLTVPSTDLFN